LSGKIKKYFKGQSLSSVTLMKIDFKSKSSKAGNKIEILLFCHIAQPYKKRIILNIEMIN